MNTQSGESHPSTTDDLRRTARLAGDDEDRSDEPHIVRGLD
ncbi:hypothetical protein ABZY03_21130 [Streptomyces klenkii]